MRHFLRRSRFLLPNQKAFDFLKLVTEARIDLTSAEPVSRAPNRIFEVMRSGLDDYEHFRGQSQGEELVLQPVAQFFRRQGINCTIKNVALSLGVLSGIEKTYKILRLNSSDKVLLPTPTFGYYFQQFRDEDIGFEIIPARQENGFLLDPQDLEKAIKKTDSRVLLLCYPNNPTGVIMDEKNA